MKVWPTSLQNDCPKATSELAGVKNCTIDLFPNIFITKYAYS